MPHTLRQAAKAVGKDRTTILRAVLSGKLSAARDETTGAWLIEPAELHRLYPPAASTGGGAAHSPVRISRHTGVRSTAALGEIRELQIQLEAAEAGNRLRDDMIADLRQQRDREAAERRQAQAQLAEVQVKLVALLTDQRAPAPAAPASTRR